MCDYSLHGINNRLATEGERLLVHRFRTGSIGMAAAGDLQMEETTGRRPWQWLLGMSRPAAKADCAVCIPPGAVLMLRDIPQRLRNEFGLQEVEEVRFTQITAAANAYRDAVHFRNGTEILLQRLDEGQRVDVISLSLYEPTEAPQVEEPAAFDEVWRSSNR
jgi:hypothetical protein